MDGALKRSSSAAGGASQTHVHQTGLKALRP